MVPRVHVTFADINSTYDELIEIFREDKFTRLPIYENTTDNVVGTINMKDLLLYDNTKEFHVRDILRDAYLLMNIKISPSSLSKCGRPNSTSRSSSTNTARRRPHHTGRYPRGNCREIHDEYDEDEEEDVKELGTHEYIVEGSTNLDDLNDELGLNLESDDYDSLGGFIIEHLDRLPAAGDEVTTADASAW